MRFYFPFRRLFPTCRLCYSLLSRIVAKKSSRDRRVFATTSDRISKYHLLKNELPTGPNIHKMFVIFAPEIYRFRLHPGCHWSTFCAHTNVLRYVDAVERNAMPDYSGPEKFPFGAIINAEPVL